MDITTDILARAAEHSGSTPKDIDPLDIFGSCGLEGDDADEFLLDLVEVYDIDLSGFLTYLHYNANEPPMFETAWGVDTNGQRIGYLPISVTDLARAAKAKDWQFDYPDHRLVTRNPLKFAMVLVIIALLVVVPLRFI